MPIRITITNRDILPLAPMFLRSPLLSATTGPTRTPLLSHNPIIPWHGCLSLCRSFIWRAIFLVELNNISLPGLFLQPTVSPLSVGWGSWKERMLHESDNWSRGRTSTVGSDVGWGVRWRGRSCRGPVSCVRKG
jgi:hypothetical protein